MNEYTIPTWFFEEHGSKDITGTGPSVDIVTEEIDALEKGVSDGWNETQVQEYLKTRPYLFDGLYRHGHGIFAFSELSFGGKYYADWVIGNGSSGGIDWELIELENPQPIPFRSDGHLSDAAMKGVRQIIDWRNWIKQNIDITQRPMHKSGLGLHGLDSYSHGVVVVGRNDVYSEQKAFSRYNDIRKNYQHDNSIRIISYDSFLNSMRSRLQLRRDVNSGKFISDYLQSISNGKNPDIT